MSNDHEIELGLGSNEVQKRISTEIYISAQDGSVVVPRNSQCTDLISLHFDSALFHLYSICDPWNHPSTSELCESTNRLIYNPETNNWNRSEITPHLYDGTYAQLYDLIGSSFEQTFDDSSDYNNLKQLIKSRRNETELEKPIFRILCCPRNVDIYTSVDSLVPNESNSTNYTAWSESLETPIFQNVKHGQSVFQPAIKFSSQSWQILTRSAIHLNVVVDLLPTSMKLLFCDARCTETIDIAATQSEFYLLLGFWFDNFHEIVEDVHLSADQLDTYSFPDKTDGICDYGSTSYLSYFINRKMEFEILVIFSQFSLSMGLEKAYFPRKVPSHEYLQKCETMTRSELFLDHPFFSPADKKTYQNGNFGQEIYPLGRLETRSVLVRVQADLDVVQIGITVGAVRAFDGRLPPSPNSVVLEVCDTAFKSPSSYCYGLVDFFEIFSVLDPTEFTYVSPTPLSVGIVLSSRLNWMNINLALEDANLRIQNLDICFLISEYFSCYFRFFEFGNPALSAYYQLDSSIIPLGGTDFRIFLRKPHIAVLDSECISAFFLESEDRVMYRYAYDTSGSYKTLYDIRNLTLVLVPEFSFQQNYRGIRGSSGFGNSKTVVEYMNFLLFQHFNRFDNLEDVKLELVYSETSRLSQSNTFRMRNDIPGLDIVIPETSFTNSPASFSTNFPSESCDVVISFEDIVQLKKMIDSLLSSPSTEPKEEKPSYFEKLSHFCMFAKVSGIKLLLIDNVLGMHLPFFQVFEPSTSDFMRNNFSVRRSSRILRSHIVLPKSIGWREL
jgi:hypothetical protein